MAGILIGELAISSENHQIHMVTVQVQAAHDAGTAKLKKRQYQKIDISPNLSDAKFSTISCISITYYLRLPL